VLGARDERALTAMAFDVALSNRLGGNKFELSLRDRSGKIQNFHAAETDIVDAMKEAMLLNALETQTIAFELCAVDTGFMRDHIDVVTSEQNLVYEIGWRAEDFFNAGFEFYPMFVVLGTRFLPPRDPLTPAHEMTKPKYVERMRELVGIALERRRMH
jgi:hypothetical protein